MNEAAKASRWREPPLAGIHTVVVDEPQSLSPVRTRLLLRSINEWLNAGLNVVISLAAGSPLESQDLYDFFSCEDPEGKHHGRRSYDASAPFRKACFEQYLEKGVGVFVWCSADNQEELAPGIDRKTSDLVSIMDPTAGHSEAAVERANESIRVVKAGSEWEEIRSLGSDLKKRLMDGSLHPRDAVIAVPDLPRYAPLIQLVAKDLGIPIDISSAAHLVRTPTGVVLSALLRLSIGSPSPQDYTDLLSGSPVSRSFDEAPERVLRRLLLARVRSPWPHQWASDLAEWNQSQARASDITATVSTVQQIAKLDQELLAPLRAASTPTVFQKRIEDALRGLGLPGLPDDPSGVSAGAWRAVMQLLEEARGLAQHLPPSQEATTWFGQYLGKQITQASFRTGPPQPDAVQVLGSLELRGLSPKYLWFAGLTRGSYPSARSPHPLISSPVWLQLQAVVPIAEARSQLQALLREASISGTTLRLSCPLYRDGKPVPPASPLAEFLDGLGPVAARLTGTLPPEASHFVSEHLRDGESASEEVKRLLVYQNRRIEAMNSPLSGFDGIGIEAPDLSGGVSVTRFERYVQCPARDWYANRLRLTDVGERQEDATPLTVGSLLHKVLEVFVQTHQPLYSQSPPDEQAMANGLIAVVDSVLGEPDVQPSLSEDGRNDLKARWLAGLKDDAPKGVLAMWLEGELKRLPQRVPLGVEVDIQNITLGAVRLKGRMDRLDAVDDDGVLVVDFKSGAAPTFGKLQTGLAMQSFLYSESVRLQWPDRPLVGSVYSSVGKADAMKESAWMGDASLLKRVAARVRNVVVLDEETRALYLEHATQAARGLADGVHHTTHAAPSEIGCDRCAFHRICRFDASRADEQREVSSAVGPMEAK